MAAHIKMIIFLATAFYMCGQREAKILRNNALMNRMISNFHRDNGASLKASNKNINSREWQQQKQRDEKVPERAETPERDTEMRGKGERNDRINNQDPHKDPNLHPREIESYMRQQNEDRMDQRAEQAFSRQSYDKENRQRVEKLNQEKNELEKIERQDRFEIKADSNLVDVMKNILCKHFPSIPCYLIVKDASLSGLLDKSIKQINHKHLHVPETTTTRLESNRARAFSTVNSEDLSSFLQVRAPTVVYKNNRKDNDPMEFGHKTKAAEIREKQMRQEKNRRQSKPQSDGTPQVVSDKNVYYKGRKKLRKFYPHKYKDNSPRLDNYNESHEDRMSISLESPDAGTGARRKRKHLKRNDDEGPGIWRIDYMKHGEPSLAKVAYAMTADEPFKAKISKTFDKDVLIENGIDQSVRRDIVHPDVYITTNVQRNKR